MKSRGIPSIYIELQPSLIILGCYAVISILSIASLLLVILPFWLKLAGVLVLIIATIYVVMRDVLLCLPWSWQTVEVNSKGKLILTNRSQQRYEPMLKASSLNVVLLTVLNFKLTSLALGYRSSLWMTVYQVRDKDQYRRLRVWLAWGQTS